MGNNYYRPVPTEPVDVEGMRVFILTVNAEDPQLSTKLIQDAVWQQLEGKVSMQVTEVSGTATTTPSAVEDVDDMTYNTIHKDGYDKGRRVAREDIELAAKILEVDISRVLEGTATFRERQNLLHPTDTPTTH